MKVVFCSNFLNHHQLPFCKAFLAQGVEFHFIATTPIPQERLDLGYADMNRLYDFVVRTYESNDEANRAQMLVDEADIVILGSAPYQLVKKRLANKKITFFYSERIYKQKPAFYRRPVHAVRYLLRYTRHPKAYLLGASAYAAKDFAEALAFWGKSYKFGYFPEVQPYDLEELLAKKQNQKTKILWAGRFLKWKHGDAAILLAEQLKSEGYDFQLDIIGGGEEESKLQTLIREKGLSDCVHMLGSMSPENVRAHMEQANIYLFTSDFNEGWGAVLNESMNSGCAVVASHAIGAVPFLIRNGENGLIYENGSLDSLYRNVKLLLEDPELRREMGKKAYETLATLWNPETAAARVIRLAAELDKGGKESPFGDGPCSKAAIIKEDWFRG